MNVFQMATHAAVIVAVLWVANPVLFYEHPPAWWVQEWSQGMLARLAMTLAVTGAIIPALPVHVTSTGVGVATALSVLWCRRRIAKSNRPQRKRSS